MSIGDRIFWSMICTFVIFLVWLKFVEPLIPLWGSLIASGIVAVVIATHKGKSPRKKN